MRRSKLRAYALVARPAHGSAFSKIDIFCNAVLQGMASNLFVKRDCAVRFRLRSAAALATSAKREVPRANGRAAAGSAADFLCYTLFFRNTIFGAVILIILH